MYPSFEFWSLSDNSFVDFFATSAECPFFLNKSMWDTTAVLTTWLLLSIKACLKNFSMFCKYCSSIILVSTLNALALKTSLSVSWTSLVRQEITINTSFSETLSSYKRVRHKTLTYLNQDVDESPQVLVELVPLTLGDLEQLRDIEEQLAFLVFSEDLALVEQEDDFVKQCNALLFFQGLIIENIALLHQSRLGQV